MTPSITLTLMDGSLAGQRYCIAGRHVCVVGRGEECTLRLPDEPEYNTVSRYHCVLDVDPPQIRVGDFGSTNGTWINGMRIERHLPWHVPEGREGPLGDHELCDGDELALGGVRFMVSVVDVEALHLPSVVA